MDIWSNKTQDVQDLCINFNVIKLHNNTLSLVSISWLNLRDSTVPRLFDSWITMINYLNFCFHPLFKSLILHCTETTQVYPVSSHLITPHNTTPHHSDIIFPLIWVLFLWVVGCRGRILSQYEAGKLRIKSYV